MINCEVGYNGERPDPVSGMTHLGRGYRAFNAVLQRFTTPDTFSPFEVGGVNTYAYCAGDPVNHADPSGHLSWQAWVGIGMGAVGLAMAVFTAGTSIAAAGGMMAALESASALSLVTGVAGALSDVAAIASGAAEGSHPQASATLGWVSLGLGIVGMIKGAAGLSVKRSRPFRRLMAGGDAEEWAPGQFRNPRYLGYSAEGNHGFDFTFEDETHSGRRRLNIMTQGGVVYGAHPRLTVRLWNDTARTNDMVLLSPHRGLISRLDSFLMDEAGRRYSVYRFGASDVGRTRNGLGSAGFGQVARSFALLFSERMWGSAIEVSRGRVTLGGDAWEDVRHAVREVRRRGASLDRVHGQDLLNVATSLWGQQEDAFTMESDEWVTYLNGRTRRSRFN